MKVEGGKVVAYRARVQLSFKYERYNDANLGTPVQNRRGSGGHSAGLGRLSWTACLKHVPHQATRCVGLYRFQQLT